MSRKVTLRRNVIVVVRTLEQGQTAEEYLYRTSGSQEITGITMDRQSDLTVVGYNNSETYEMAGVGYQTVGMIFLSVRREEGGIPHHTLSGNTVVLSSGYSTQALFDNRLVDVSTSATYGFLLDISVDTTGGTTTFSQNLELTGGTRQSAADLVAALQSDLESKLPNAPFKLIDDGGRIHVVQNPDFTGDTFSQFNSVEALGPTGTTNDMRFELFGSEPAGATSENMVDDVTTEGFRGRLVTMYPPSELTLILQNPSGVYRTQTSVYSLGEI